MAIIRIWMVAEDPVAVQCEVGVAAEEGAVQADVKTTATIPVVRSQIMLITWINATTPPTNRWETAEAVDVAVVAGVMPAATADLREEEPPAIANDPTRVGCPSTRPAGVTGGRGSDCYWGKEIIKNTQRDAFLLSCTWNRLYASRVIFVMFRRFSCFLFLIF